MLIKKQNTYTSGATASILWSCCGPWKRGPGSNCRTGLSGGCAPEDAPDGCAMWFAGVTVIGEFVLDADL